MRLLNQANLAKLPHEPEVRFFIQAWYGMTHAGSLDSHRVRCMNPCNIIREFIEIIKKEFITSLDGEITKIASELREIFDIDYVVQNYYKKEYDHISSLIEDYFQEQSSSKNKKVTNTKKFRLMCFYVEKLKQALHVGYKKNLLKELKEEIFSRKDFKKIHQMTCCLLSVLLDEGFTLDNLYSLARDILIDNKSKMETSFRQNYEFIERYIDRENHPYTIVFRLKGFRNINIMPASIAAITFNKTYDLGGVDGKKFSRFLSPESNVLFASTILRSKDPRAAGYKTRELLEEILDLVRFELEEETISVSDEFISIKESKVKSFKIIDNIPNPSFKVSTEEFSLFLKFVINYLNVETNSKDLKNKLISTLRFYRIGRDSRNLENKFLNWWTALEHLVRTGSQGGGIYDHTEAQTVPLLILNYIPKLLNSYRDSIAFCKVLPTETAKSKYHVRYYSQLRTSDFFDLIRSGEEFAHIKTNLVQYPILSHAIEEFHLNLVDGKSINGFLEKHELHLKWHLSRIWRARCDLVHSAKIDISLNLLCANLEFYLKTVFSMIVKCLMSADKPMELLELYDLILYKYDLTKSSLNREDFSMLKNTINNDFIS